jgi:hypothetical protein
MDGRIKLLSSFIIRISCNIKGKLALSLFLRGKCLCGDYNFLGFPLSLLEGVVSFKMW